MTHEMLTVFYYCGILVAGMMFLLWLISLWAKDASIVDLAWGTGFVLIAWTAFFFNTKCTDTNWILPILTTIWGLRLTVYLTWRNLGHTEDYRYQAMRKHWGAAFPIMSLLIVFVLQGAVIWIVSLPLQLGIAVPVRQVPALTTPGIALWAIGFFFETIGDWQLSKFKSDEQNKSKVLNTGLWKYTRHPNYFGDFLVWWGFFIVAISYSDQYWIVIGPFIMSLFLMRISGVTLLEKSLKESKEGYIAYQKRTNAFFPWINRKQKKK